MRVLVKISASYCFLEILPAQWTFRLSLDYLFATCQMEEVLDVASEGNDLIFIFELTQTNNTLSNFNFSILLNVLGVSGFV